MDDLPFIDGEETVVLFSSREAEQQYLALKDNDLNRTVALFDIFVHAPKKPESANTPSVPVELVITLLRSGQTQFADFSQTLKLRGMGSYEGYFLSWYAYGYFLPELEAEHKRHMSLGEFIQKDHEPANEPDVEQATDYETLFSKLWDKEERSNALVVPITIPSKNGLLIRQTNLKGSYLFTRNHIVLFTSLPAKKQFLEKKLVSQLQDDQIELLTIELSETEPVREPTDAPLPPMDSETNKPPAEPETVQENAAEPDTDHASGRKLFRPYFFKSLDALEQLFTNNGSSEDILKDLKNELETRQTKGAKHLLQQVEDALNKPQQPETVVTPAPPKKASYGANSLAHLYPIENTVECKRFYAQSFSAAIEKSPLPPRTKSAIRYWKTQGRLKYKTIGEIYTATDGGRALCSIPGIGGKSFEQIRDYLISLAPQSTETSSEESHNKAPAKAKASLADMHSLLNRRWAPSVEVEVLSSGDDEESIPPNATEQHAVFEDTTGSQSPLPEYVALANTIRKALPVSDFQIIMGRGVQELQYDQLGQRLNMSRRDVRKREQRLLSEVSLNNQQPLTTFLKVLNQHLDSVNGDTTLEAAGEVTRLPSHQLKLLVYIANSLQEQPCWVEGNRLFRMDGF